MNEHIRAAESWRPSLQTSPAAPALLRNAQVCTTLLFPVLRPAYYNGPGILVARVAALLRGNRWCYLLFYFSVHGFGPKCCLREHRSLPLSLPLASPCCWLAARPPMWTRPSAGARTKSTRAFDEASTGSFDEAVPLYEKLRPRRRHRPGQQASLEKAYANYKSGEKPRPSPHSTALWKLHPASEAVDYALYLKGLVPISTKTWACSRL